MIQNSSDTVATAASCRWHQSHFNMDVARSQVLHIYALLLWFERPPEHLVVVVVPRAAGQKAVAAAAQLLSCSHSTTATSTATACACRWRRAVIPATFRRPARGRPCRPARSGCRAPNRAPSTTATSSRRPSWARMLDSTRYPSPLPRPSLLLLSSSAPCAYSDFASESIRRQSSAAETHLWRLRVI